MQLPVYLDCNATTPLDPRVLDAMMPYFTKHFGNAASKSHAYGWIAMEAVDKARQQIASLINANKEEIYFTSGATESINLAIKGVFERYSSMAKNIIIAATEHKAVLDTCKHLEKWGAEITVLPVNTKGMIDLNRLRDTITSNTLMICVMYANNETGVIMPIEEIATIANEKKVLFMTDATQAVGKIPVNVDAGKIHLLAMNAHKMYGPKGIGALYIRKKDPRVSVTAQMDGGGHENGVRSGTLNVAGIAGFGKASEIADRELTNDALRIVTLRDKLEKALLKIPGTILNSDASNRLPNTINISFGGNDSNTLMRVMSDHVAMSSGSACTSADQKPSHVLRAMGFDEKRSGSAIRFSLGRFTTMDQINYVIDKFYEHFNC